ncbi:enediyne biosynthesis protein [Streptomyces sp. S.PB5]|uniref:enediyne biosynthesis protein n=1 Tax=Streptomyces sp. S.PB5 TaxID=3020844 RepID=UPI0025AEE138|nr:enediyne biosynthesis protein [Streptomyces sp. S.PB5]MDN3022770.1 enediyne biosynthesis protein [Streptomyces sp. S.PB5]
MTTDHTCSAGDGKPCGACRRSKALRRFAMSITAATVLGHTVLGFEQAYATPLFSVLAALLTESLLETIEAWSQRRAPRYMRPVGQTVDFLLPAYIGGLACAMLLYANSNLWPTVLAAVVGVSSKYLFRVKVKGVARHVLNPSNFGIVVVLLLFPWVGIAPPYQFSEWLVGWADVLPPLVVLVLGTLLNGKLTGKLPLILGWVGGFAVQALVRGFLTGTAIPSALLVMTGPAFILFTNYMITDPGTSPWRKRNQVVFGATVAALYGVLVQLHVVFGLFFALVLACVLRAALLAVLARRDAGSVPAPRQETSRAEVLPPLATAGSGATREVS